MKLTFKEKIFLKVTLFLSLTFFVIPTSAESTSTDISLGLAERVSNTYTWALGIGGMLALGIIIFGGVLYSASGGNPGRMDEAKKWIQHALFGLALLFSSYLLLNFINPDLTRLEEIFLDPNPQVQGPTLERLPGGGRFNRGDATCRARSLENVTTYGNCGGYYVEDSADFNFVPGPNALARAGNFGDPLCEKKNLSRTDFLQEIREVMRNELRTAGFCNTNVERLTTIFVDGIGGYGAVIEGESGYNPNAVLLRGDYRADGKKVPECTGAWGLLQMSKNGYPEGDAPWRDQIKDAVLKIDEGPRGHLYWAQWPGRTDFSDGLPKEVSCSSGNP